jgi:hypothetical protein
MTRYGLGDGGKSIGARSRIRKKADICLLLRANGKCLVDGPAMSTCHSIRQEKMQVAGDARYFLQKDRRSRSSRKVNTYLELEMRP